MASSLAYVGTHRRRPFPRGRIGKGLLTSRMDRASHGKRKGETDKRYRRKRENFGGKIKLEHVAKSETLLVINKACIFYLFYTCFDQGIFFDSLDAIDFPLEYRSTSLG